MMTVSPTARTWAQISLKALRHNLNYVKEQTGKMVMCVVKADAYGHGAVACAQCLQAAGADAFGVASLAEAMELREGGVSTPILVLGYTDPEYARMLADNGITQAIQELEPAWELSRRAVEEGVTVEVHVKLDTGMGRTGILAQTPETRTQAVEEIQQIYHMPGLRVTGVFTHFSVADDPEQDDYTRWQMENYRAVLSEMEARGLEPGVRHAGNSAAVMRHPDTHLDMVRAGNMLYGLYPDSKPAPDGPLAPVMSLYSRVAQVRDLPAGASVSYGRTYQAPSPIKTAVVAAGYADGYPRRLSNQAWAVIDGVAYPQIGTICMDAHMLDISCAPQPVQPGDPVLLWGPGGMSVEAVAQAVGTINYELTSLVTKRVPRVYVEEEEL